MPTQVRLDERLVAEGLAADRREAEALIRLGRVLVDDAPVEKPGARVGPRAALRVRRARSGRAQHSERFVSRGGDKLAGALADLGFDPRARHCLDLGAATGGFCDCLLQHGARSVTAVDTGYGLLAERLRSDPRVRVLERCNARSLRAEQLAAKPERITVDLSFTSSAGVLPALRALAPAAECLVLVKPQFELPRARVGQGGIVRDASARAEAVASVREAARAHGYTPQAEAESRLPGARGNRETFLWLVPSRA